jgi:hypothetical protein
MWMLVATLCAGCAPGTDALTPYFEGTIVARPSLTLEAPCPDGSAETARRDRVVTCAAPSAPGDALELTFDDHGTLVAYQTFARGVRSGTSGRWSEDGALLDWQRWRDDRKNGRHAVYDDSGKRILDESYVDDQLQGPYTKRVVGEHADSGQYIAGVRAGTWTEWRGNGQWRGNYLSGARSGIWTLQRENELSPDYTVTFDSGTPVSAERTVERYHGLMGGLDAALLGVALYGHYAERRSIKYAGGAAFFALPPLLHLIEQPAGARRTTVGQAYGVRPAAVAAVLTFYTLGKLIDGLDCHETYSDEGSSSCGDVSFDFNSHYNWNGVLLVSAILAALGDVELGSVRRPVAVDEVWPQIDLTPTQGGASIRVGGVF